MVAPLQPANSLQGRKRTLDGGGVCRVRSSQVVALNRRRSKGFLRPLPGRRNLDSRTGGAGSRLHYSSDGRRDRDASESE